MCNSTTGRMRAWHGFHPAGVFISFLLSFSPKQNQRRRQGSSRRPSVTHTQSHYTDTAARRPINTGSNVRSRPQSKSGSTKGKRTRRPGANRKAQNRQQTPGGLTNAQQRPIPLFLRPPRPSRPGQLGAHVKTVPSGPAPPPPAGDYYAILSFFSIFENLKVFISNPQLYTR